MESRSPGLSESGQLSVHWEAVLVIYCCIINYHKLTGLKQYMFITSQFLWIRNPGCAGCSALRPVTRLRVKEKTRAGVSAEGSDGHFQDHVAVGKIQFLLD